MASSSTNHVSNNMELVLPERQSRYVSSSQWLSDISTRQQEFVTPEMRNKIAEKGQRQKVRARKKKRAKLYQKTAVLNKRAWGQGNRKMMLSAPANYNSSTMESRNQMRSIQSVYQSRNEAVSYEDDAFDEEEEQLETMVNNLEIAQLADDVQVDDENSMTQILNQLRREPTNEQEIATKFQLYETFLGTVEDSRKATYDFWKECKPDFDAVENSQHIIQSIEKGIKDIDSGDNLGIVFDRGNWFVYDMTVKADSNNEKLKACIHDLEIKLDLLDKDDECPFCLEKGQESVTLGCCHKACVDCWTHWQELKGQNAFCPLCRQEDFLENMAEAQN